MTSSSPSTQQQQRQIEKLTKKILTLEVINGALRQENDTLREEEIIIPNNDNTTIGNLAGEDNDRIKHWKLRANQLQSELQQNELKLAEEMNERERLERVRLRQDGEIENLKVSMRTQSEELRRSRMFSEQLRVEQNNEQVKLMKKFDEERDNFAREFGEKGKDLGELEKVTRSFNAEKERRKDLETRIRELEETLNSTASRHGKEQDVFRRERLDAESRARALEDELTTAEVMRAEAIAPLIKQMESQNEERMREIEKRDFEENRLKAKVIKAETELRDMEDEVKKLHLTVEEKEKKIEMLFSSLKMKMEELDSMEAKRREALAVLKETQTKMNEMRDVEKDLRSQCTSMEKQLQRAIKSESESIEKEKLIKIKLKETKDELEASVKFGKADDNENEILLLKEDTIDDSFLGFSSSGDELNQTATVVIQTLKRKLKETSNRLLRAEEKRKEMVQNERDARFKMLDVERKLSQNEREHATLVELLGEKIERIQILESITL